MCVWTCSSGTQTIPVSSSSLRFLEKACSTHSGTACRIPRDGRIQRGYSQWGLSRSETASWLPLFTCCIGEGSSKLSVIFAWRIWRWKAWWLPSGVTGSEDVFERLNGSSMSLQCKRPWFYLFLSYQLAEEGFIEDSPRLMSYSLPVLNSFYLRLICRSISMACLEKSVLFIKSPLQLFEIICERMKTTSQFLGGADEFTVVTDIN